ncbi:MAG TPA: hypothetical protein VHO72_07530 [Bacteroidales bacterium]|nr:hypothetical protein [Bacteroidales bacterium]
MNRKTLKKFLIISVSLPVIVVGIVLACSGGDEFEDYFNSFFAPEVSHADDFSPFFRSQNVFYGSYGYYDDGSTAFDATNISEWERFFNNTVSEADLQYVVYKSRIGEIDTMIFFLKNNQYPVKPYLKQNSLLRFNDPSITREVLYYLGFAKRCEPYATYIPDYWDDERSDDPRKNTAPMQKLIDAGKRSFTNAMNENLKQRYLFQLVRLLYNSEQYEECISFYEQNKNLLNSESSVKYRTMGYAAGAHYKLGEYSQANYLYAVAYDHAPEFRIIAFQNFHPQDETDWEGSLELAKNNREKEALWHLLGLYADPLRAMKEIYALNPKSDLLDVLLTRAINIEEESFIPSLWESDKNDASYALTQQNVNAALLTFIEEAANKKNTAKPYLWNLAAGYLNTIQQSYKKAEDYLKKAEAGAKNDTLVAEQTRLIRVITKVELLSSPGKKAEDELAKELTWLSQEKHNASLRAAPMVSWAQKRLSAKFLAFGDIVKAQCLDYTSNRAFYNDPDKVKALVALIDKKDKTRFEEYVLSVHPFSRNDLFEYEAINLVYQGELKEAIAKFEESEGSGDAVLPADPFLIHINDCHDCDFEAPQEISYSKYTLLKKMIELEDKAEKEPKNAAKYYFELANAYYNITYYGNSRAFYYNNVKPAETVWDFSPSFADFSDSIYHCTKAEEYYDKALTLSKDPEFSAKCCFMAAKCEQNRFFISTEYTGDFRAGLYFKVLRARYGKTRYYQEIIKECGYFRTYLGLKSK